MFRPQSPSWRVPLFSVWVRTLLTQDPHTLHVDHTCELIFQCFILYFGGGGWVGWAGIFIP